MNKILEKNIFIRNAIEEDSKNIHNILSNAFSPYIKYYTNRAYKETVISPQDLKKRILDKGINVIVAIYNNKIVGTVSFEYKPNYIYLSGMAVDPKYQNKDIGHCLLNKIQKEAIQKNSKLIRLDSYYPLKKAILFYESHGFSKTGKKQDYYGIEVFEMIKEFD